MDLKNSFWVYFDWNVLSNLDSSEKSHYKKLVTKSKVNSFFTDEHVWEATNIPEGHEKFEDIKNSSLEIIDEFLPFYFERKKYSDDFKCFKTSAFEVYKQKKDDFKTKRKTFKESLHKSNYKETKLNEISNLPNKLSPKYLNNYSTKEVINKINEILNTDENADYFSNKIKLPITFSKIFKYHLDNLPHYKGLEYQVITQAYVLLNTLGFRRDKIGHDEFLGSWMDSHHLSNASLCQLFITDDTKLRKKTKVVYDYLKLKTQVESSKDGLKTLQKYA